MTSDAVSELEIHAYIDDELEPVRRMAVEEYLARDGAAAARVMADLRLRSALGLALHDDRPLGPTMVTSAERLRQRIARRRWRWRGVVGLASAAAVAAFLIPSVLQDDVPAYVGDAVMSHRIGLMRAAMPSQVENAHFDAHEVMRSTNIRMPVLPDGWQITDVQLFPADSGPALQIMIRTDAARVVSMFAQRSGRDEATEPVAIQRGDDAVAYWNRDGVGYALVGAEPAAEIDRAADDLADNILA
ncbi:anti-sigma factor family protein [Hephaestia sp. GCM10023244]|uniref:anti-sigma factor family protein n=1 Tax=unclassified Hephaestia TaxID=2631281 RepID=UPI0020771788|nr:anti-sigma factor [Hephaestia sp. MAHUQ-44]MCM8730077.1 anti-sigma factor [Hephaestia sp. MAHUQ-44]